MLGLVDYGSSSDEEEAAPSSSSAAAASTVVATAVEGEDEEPVASDDVLGASESEEEEEAPSTKALPSVSGLPSAASLLSGRSSASSWLKKPKWATAPKTLDAVVSPPPAPAAVAPSAVPDATEYGDDMYASYDPAKGWQRKQATNIEGGHGGYKGSVGAASLSRADLSSARSLDAISRHTPSHDSGRHAPKKRDKPDRVNAKERVKQQRLNGQSGIGENFKVWRSEEEMRLRQTYD